MSSQLDSGRWLLRLPSAGSPRLRLICFPYAGGGPDLFRTWKGELSPGVEIVGVRLPGRGSRLREPMYSSWPALIQDTYEAIEDLLDEPHAFYGHSFGGRLAYELTHVAAARHPGSTSRLFVSGCRSPDTPQRRPYMHELSDSEFRSALRAMGGTPDAILDHPALMRTMLLTVHNDIRLAELWTERHGRGVPVPITAVTGRDDPIDDERSMRGWLRFSPDAELLEIPAGHFFVETHRRQLLGIINSRLEVIGA